MKILRIKTLLTTLAVLITTDAFPAMQDYLEQANRKRWKIELNKTSLDGRSMKENIEALIDAGVIAKSLQQRQIDDILRRIKIDSIADNWFKITSTDNKKLQLGTINIPENMNSQNINWLFGLIISASIQQNRTNDSIQKIIADIGNRVKGDSPQAKLDRSIADINIYFTQFHVGEFWGGRNEPKPKYELEAKGTGGTQKSLSQSMKNTRSTTPLTKVNQPTQQNKGQIAQDPTPPKAPPVKQQPPSTSPTPKSIPLKDDITKVKLKDQQEQAERLKSQIEQLNINIQRLEQQRIDKTISNAALERDINQKQAEITDLTQEIAQLNQNKINLQSQISKLKAELSKQEQEKTRVEQEMHQKQTESIAAEQRKESINKEMASLTTQKGALENDRNLLRQQHDAIERENSDLQKTNKDLEAQVTQKQTQSQQLQGHIKSYESQKQSLEEEIEKVNKQKKTLENEVEALRNKQDQGKKAIEEQQKALAELSNKQKEVTTCTNKEAEEKVAELTKIKSQLSQRKTDLNNIDQQMQEKKTQKERIEIQVKAVELELTQKEQQLRDIEGQIPNKSQQLSNLGESCRTETSKLEQIKTEIQAKKTELAEAQTGNQVAKADLDRLKEELGTLRDTKDQTEKVIETLAQRKTEAEKASADIESLKAELGALRGEKEQLEKDIQNLAQRKEEEEKERAAAQEEVRKTELDKTQKGQQLREIEGQITNTSQQLSKLGESCRTEASNLEQITTEIKAKQSERTETQKAAQAAKDELATIENELTTITGKKTQLTQDIEILAQRRTEAEKASADIESLKGELETLAGNKAKLEKDIEILGQQKKEAEKDKGAAEVAKQEALTQAAAAQQEEERIRLSSQTAMNQKSQLVEELQTIKENKDRAQAELNNIRSQADEIRSATVNPPTQDNREQREIAEAEARLKQLQEQIEIHQQEANQILQRSIEQRSAFVAPFEWLANKSSQGDGLPQERTSSILARCWLMQMKSAPSRQLVKVQPALQQWIQMEAYDIIPICIPFNPFQEHSSKLRLHLNQNKQGEALESSNTVLPLKDIAASHPVDPDVNRESPGYFVLDHGQTHIIPTSGGRRHVGKAWYKFQGTPVSFTPNPLEYREGVLTMVLPPEAKTGRTRPPPPRTGLAEIIGGPVSAENIKEVNMIAPASLPIEPALERMAKEKTLTQESLGNPITEAWRYTLFVAGTPANQHWLEQRKQRLKGNEQLLQADAHSIILSPGAIPGFDQAIIRIQLVPMDGSQVLFPQVDDVLRNYSRVPTHQQGHPQEEVPPPTPPTPNP
ncbi:MAG: hypothetical protein LBF65_00790 [Holosporales bacterium]|jgi:predicted  nucleic acid-binding Zn-ribbon protein|nr:hypothetical protein [Holosporales bacterium]